MQPRPLTPDRKRHVMRCVGVIDPRQVYTTEGLLRFAGIGREMLVVARASGIVRPIEIGHRLYYLGAEVIRWIESQREVGRVRSHSNNRGSGPAADGNGGVAAVQAG